jgi:hypothetical protein
MSLEKGGVVKLRIFRPKTKMATVLFTIVTSKKVL